MDATESLPLHDAAREGNVMIARNLLQEDKSLCLKKDHDGRTALFWAVSSNHNEAASEILKVAKSLKRFDIDETDEAGWTVLHIAASTGNLKVIEELLLPLDAEVNAQTNSGQTPLHFATSKQHLDVVRLLLQNKATPRTKDKQGQTPLHRAAAVGSLPIAKALIEAKCAINPTDAGSWTPLHHATAEGHGDVALEIIKAGGDLERTDAEGLTPMDVAVDDKVRNYIQTNIKN